jgi:outer membrane protein assembly factor BamB
MAIQGNLSSDSSRRLCQHGSFHLNKIWLCFFLFLMLFSICSCTFKWTNTQLTDLDSRHLWSHTFPQKVVYLHITQGGIVNVLTAEKQGKQLEGEGERWLIDAETGKIIWKGSIQSGQLLADGRYPVVVEHRNSSFDLKSISRSGDKIWQKEFEEKYIYGIPDSDLNEIYVLSAPPSNQPKKTAASTLKRISIKTGEIQWQATFESNTENSHYLGIPMISIGQDVVYLLFKNTAACVDLSSGRLLWEKRLNEASPSEKPLPILWCHQADTAQAAFGNRIMCFSEEKSILWNAVLHKSGIVHDLFHTHEGVVVGYHMRTGAGVVLYDIHSGNEKWRYEYKDETLNKEHFANSLAGVVLSDNRLWFGTANHLISLNLKTGQVADDIEIDPKKFVDYSSLLFHRPHLILKGLHRVEARTSDTGTILWEHGPFLTPFEVIADMSEKDISKPRKIKADTSQAERDYLIAKAVENQYAGILSLRVHLLSMPLYPNLYSGAIGYQAYWTSLGTAMAFTGKALAFKFTLSDIVTQDVQPPIKYIWFVECAYKSKMEVNLSSHAYIVLIDVDSGSIERMPLLSSKIEPVTAVVDQAGKRVAEVYITLGLMAKKGVDLDMLRLK